MEMQRFVSSHKAQTIPEKFKELPFVSGILGYCSYPLGEHIHKLPVRIKHNSDIHFPDVFLGSYSWSYVFDRQQDKGWLTFSPECNTELRRLILSEIERAQKSPVDLMPANSSFPWTKSQDYTSYAQAFTALQDYIFSGDCYQANLTQRFECDLASRATPFSAILYYLEQQQKLETPYSAFISFAADQKLICFSPEQFIQIKERIIESKPIKGTIANTDDPENIGRLRASVKNQAENVMIVDLLRNDLSKVCEVNSVHVPELFKIESFQNVHHMVSHIRGKLREGISEFDAFLSCFPGGSITGAPKLRAMEIIRELETHSRNAYCGSVFFWNDNGNFDSNILIRSIIQSGEKLYCWAGGGIVADSEVKDEYQESLTKVSNLTGITD